MRGFTLSAAAILTLAASLLADDVLYRYEGDVLPYDPATGWLVNEECGAGCHESIEAGAFVLRWPTIAGFANYHLWIAQPKQAPPTSLWVEWHRRSNHSRTTSYVTCGGRFTVNYRDVHETLWLYGDFVIDNGQSSYIGGLALNEIHPLTTVLRTNL